MSTRAAPQVVETCFACSQPLPPRSAPGEALIRPACLGCKLDARLDFGGASLATVLRTEGPRLEGSGLSYIVNSVQVNGHRGWVDFVAGGYAIFEEIHPSEDFFDFVMQHVEPWASMMRHLRAGGAPDREPNRIAELLARTAADSLFRVQARWDLAQRAAEARAAVGTLASSEDALRIWEMMHAGPERTASLDQLVARLATLSHTP